MTALAAAISAAETDLRWQQWEARGAAADRRTARRMKIAVFLVASGFVIRLLVLIL
ncbi:MAG TPA: hypothetical protein VH138_08595 [Vicinamibacterales bacterium]|jgi:hypothetical protein|nr:hypothetical protein [Vicinamibacterales bacterium]